MSADLSTVRAGDMVKLVRFGIAVQVRVLAVSPDEIQVDDPRKGPRGFHQDGCAADGSLVYIAL